MPHLEIFSQWFVEFFRGEPWNEYLMCPSCKELGDFGPTYSWGDSTDLTQCPGCNTRLVLYWSEKRVRLYLTKEAGNRCRMAYSNSQLAGWIFGYPMSRTIFYLDTLAVLPKYRQEVGTSVFHRLLMEYLEELEAEGFTNIFARTHKQAKMLRVFLSALGFVERNPSTEDPERTYWRRRKAR